jgi:hypothetical protein
MFYGSLTHVLPTTDGGLVTDYTEGNPLCEDLLS